jgi:hypothetical protein
MTTIVAWNNVLWYLKGGAAVTLDNIIGTVLSMMCR